MYNENTIGEGKERTDREGKSNTAGIQYGRQLGLQVVTLKQEKLVFILQYCCFLLGLLGFVSLLNSENSMYSHMGENNSFYLTGVY